MKLENTPYPRVVAHRGLSKMCPENTMAAFGAAIGIGASEIELDIWGSRDRELIVCHDPTVDRTSNGTGHIKDLDYTYIAGLDAGSWLDEGWAEIPFCTLEEVFKVYGKDIVMNLHIKEAGEGGWIIKKVSELATEYNIINSIYIAGQGDVLRWAIELAPDIERCCLERGAEKSIVDHAIEYGCKRLQFTRDGVTKELIQRAHEHGIVCNLFYTDTYEEARAYIGMGIDSILTNYANLILPILEDIEPYIR